MVLIWISTWLLIWSGLVSEPEQQRMEAEMARCVGLYLHMDSREVKELIHPKHLESHHLALAAIIAKKSGRPLASVLGSSHLTEWFLFAGIEQMEPEEIWEELKRYFPQIAWYPQMLRRHPTILREALIRYLHEDQRTINHLLKHSQFTAVQAAVLAKASGLHVERVLAMKGEKYNWDEMEQRLHVSSGEIARERRQLKQTIYNEIVRWRKAQTRNSLERIYCALKANGFGDGC